MNATALNANIESSWKVALSSEFQKPYFTQLKQFLVEEKAKGAIIYPPGSLIFNSFKLCPFDRVKVVIIGQDPYHGPDQAHGLCFSVQKGVKVPPSLVNIFKELNTDMGIAISPHGNLENWASQGVLLLNSVLTVQAHKPASHAKRGWELFTDSVISYLNQNKKGLIFLLWGRRAQEKGCLIDTQRHHVLKAPHPSPFSAHNGFFGCRHFSKANKLLQDMARKPIDWSLM